jgi:hypothetical protein
VVMHWYQPNPSFLSSLTLSDRCGWRFSHRQLRRRHTAAAASTGDPAPPLPSPTATSLGCTPLATADPLAMEAEVVTLFRGLAVISTHRPCRLGGGDGDGSPTSGCRSAPATQHPFRLLESGRRRLPLPRLPQAAPTSGGRSSGTAAPASRAVGRRRLRLERRSSGHTPARKCQYLFSTRTLSASACSCLLFYQKTCMSISEDSVNKYSSKLENGVAVFSFNCVLV